jgi:hypothetical protein
MTDTSRIREHMEVRGSDGEHVGTVDHLEGSDRIKLARNDPAADGQHHFIPVSWVDRVDGHVHLIVSGQEAKRNWQEGG